MDGKVLEIEDLQVDFLHDGTYQAAVRDVSFSVYGGRTLGIVGESGSGKSVSSMSIMGLLPPPSSCRISGRISVNSEMMNGKADHASLILNSQFPIRNSQMSEWMDFETWNTQIDRYRWRGSRISMIFQEPMTSLNPVQKCGAQVMEMLLAHEHVTHQEARSRVLQLFEEVRLPRPETIFDSYPHEISGGQKQRVMIAMALICHPDLLIADEPTTALDVTVQKAIIDLLHDLQRKYNIGIIFISHDLGVIAQIADEVAVMYRGQIVEYGDAHSILHHPQHPYTQGLLACRPPLDGRPKRLPTVRDFMESVNDESVQSGVGEDSEATEYGKQDVKQRDNAKSQEGVPLLRVRDLEVTYALEKTLMGKVTKELKAVAGLSFDLYRGETLGLVGESGCGKSTLGRAILQLLKRSAGTVEYEGVPLDNLSASATKSLRRKMQIIFQDPYSSLNPRITIGEAIMEPLRCHHLGENDRQRREKVFDLMEQVGLEPEWFGRYPHEFSGGQRQRVCIARALALEPELVVCDESVSALDVSVQAQVLNLLNDLKARHGYTYLFITHDLSVVKFLSDRIMVMEKGRVVEMGPTDQIFASPQHPYTQRLLASLPRIE